MSPQSYRVAVVGATGQVGSLMLELLHERSFPAREIVAFASSRSIGRELRDGILVQGLSAEAIEGFDLALFSAGGSVSGERGPALPRPAVWSWTTPRAGACKMTSRWW